MAAKSAKPKPQAELDPSGFSEIDTLYPLPTVTFKDYLRAASQYVREANEPTRNTKSAQTRLSKILARAVIADLVPLIPEVSATQLGERPVAGALQNVLADASQYHELDGLRLAVEIKPTYLAVGRAIWNRFRDIRSFAINIHLKFPFAVLGAVLVIPTYDLAKSGTKRPTATLAARVIRRLEQTGKRRNESDAPHLLEAVAVIVFNPETGETDTALPSAKSWLRWEAFIRDLAAHYDARFGEGSASATVAAPDAETE